jgi:hypothetical protein
MSCIRTAHRVKIAVAPFLVLCSLVGDAQPNAPQERAAVARDEEIPRNSYRSWSVFLVCNPEWVTQERRTDLAALYTRFKAFGDAIGDDNLAVWFFRSAGRGGVEPSDPSGAESVDVPRAIRYCRTLRLRPSDGPFLLITTSYPEENAVPADRAVFELGALTPKEIGTLLGKLTDELLLEGRVSPQASPSDAPAAASSPAPTETAAAQSAGLWTRLLEGARRSMIGFGCRVKLQVTTGVLSAELRECPKP